MLPFIFRELRELSWKISLCWLEDLNIFLFFSLEIYFLKMSISLL